MQKLNSVLVLRTKELQQCEKMNEKKQKKDQMWVQRWYKRKLMVPITTKTKKLSGQARPEKDEDSFLKQVDDL